MQHGRWSESVRYYGAAFEAAELLIRCPKSAMIFSDRYLRTALELIYACRKSAWPIEGGEIIRQVRRCLSAWLEPAALQQAVAPLLDVAFSPLTVVDEWMQRLFAFDQRASHTLH